MGDLIEIMPKKEIICPFCDEQHKLLNGINGKNIAEHLIVILDEEGNWHVHGPLQNRVLIMEFIRVIAKEAKIKLEG